MSQHTRMPNREVNTACIAIRNVGAHLKGVSLGAVGYITCMLYHQAREDSNVMDECVQANLSNICIFKCYSIALGPVNIEIIISS